MKHKLAVDFTFDISEIRKAIVLVTGETPSDLEIMNKYVDRKPVKMDTQDFVGVSESLQMCMAFVATIVADNDPDHKIVKK